MNLKNIIDTHQHGGPCHAPRKLLDHELALQAADAGMRAIVLKIHEGSTVERAIIAQSVANNKVSVYGGIALNDFSGGLNPFAVKSAIKMGAKIVWMPTFTSKYHLDSERKNGFLLPDLSLLCQDIEGISILDNNGELFPVVLDIIDLIAEANIILCLGHLSLPEMKTLAPIAHNRGVKKITLSHPNSPITPISLPDQKWLIEQGVIIERCVVSPIAGRTTWEQWAADIQETGIENNIIATDLGQRKNPAPVEGLNLAVENLLRFGISEADLFKMMSETPSSLLGLD